MLRSAAHALGVAIGENDRRAAADESFGDREAEAARGARDDREAAGEGVACVHAIPSSSSVGRWTISSTVASGMRGSPVPATTSLTARNPSIVSSAVKNG